MRKDNKIDAIQTIIVFWGAAAPFFMLPHVTEFVFLSAPKDCSRSNAECKT